MGEPTAKPHVNHYRRACTALERMRESVRKALLAEKNFDVGMEEGVRALIEENERQGRELPLSRSAAEMTAASTGEMQGYLSANRWHLQQAATYAAEASAEVAIAEFLRKAGQ